ncbi:plasmid replication protein, CyRepA1 family [Anabaena sp. WFMT]|uniref:plasmid replication protein, CyRepA1 family n=1 Tax=Anabaena sp. WFMT TaxID=3449730 RepID=UPI003F26DDFF
MSRLLPTNKNRPCFCGDTNGDCRKKVDSNHPFCMKFSQVRIGEVINGHKAVSLTKDGLWMIFNPVDDKGQSVPYTPQESYESPINVMSSEERNQLLRRLVKHFGLSQNHRQRLLDRGFLPDEIDLAISQNWIYSWEPGISSAGFPDNLCGVNAAKGVFHGGSGIGFSYLDNSSIVGVNIANDHRGEGSPKYYCLSSRKSGGAVPHLPNGELPIFHWVSPDAGEITETWVMEGGLKSLLTAFKLWRNNKNIQVIGIGGHNFLGHYKSIEPLLKGKIIIPPDAGSVLNKSVYEDYRKFLIRLNANKFDVSVAWWGQVDKTCGDIDELEDFSQIEYISSKEFFTIAKLGVKNAETKKIQEQKDIEKRSRFDELKAIRHGLTNITEVPYKVVNVPHLEQVLGDLIEPGTMNIIVSDAGTGKTESVVPYANKAEAFYSWHNRISLARSTSTDLGLTYKESNSNVKYSDKKKASFCVPSAYQYDPKHLAKHQGILLVDEADQVFDFLFGSLCNKDNIRPLLLSTLEAHIDSAIYGQGMCLFMSADITQKEIDLIKALAPQGTPVRLIINKYQPQRPDINFDVSESPEGLLSELVEKIATGIPCFVLDDLKNGVKGCKSLAEYVRQNFPELKDLILEIHADNQHDPRVKAFNNKPDEESKKYLMVICSPSIISGVSLKNQRFINGVFAFCNGILMDREIKQFLNRVRGAEDIYMWVSEEGFEPMGLPSNLVTLEDIKAYYQRNYEANSKYLLSYNRKYDVMSGEFSSPFFELFCKNQAYRSITAKYLRQFTREHLEEIGYGINEINPTPKRGTKEIKNKLSNIWDGIEIREAEEIAAAEFLSDSIMEAIAHGEEVPPELKSGYLKTRMLRLFGEELIEATVFTHKKTEREFTGFAAMALKNSGRKYERQLENFYLLNQDIEESSARDYAAEARQMKHGDRFAADIRWNSRKRKCREYLGLHEFLDPNKWLEPNDYNPLGEKAKKYPDDVADALGFQIKNMTNGQIFGQAMEQIGLSLDKKKVAGQKWKARKINAQDWEYCQMYLKHKEFVKTQREAINSPVEVVVNLVEAVEVDPIVPLVAEELVKTSTREECEDLFDTITEKQKISAWQLISVEHQQRITNLFSTVVDQLSLDDIEPIPNDQLPITSDQTSESNSLEVITPNEELLLVDAKINEIYPLATIDSMPFELAWKLRLNRALVMGEQIARAVYGIAYNSGLINLVWPSLTNGVQQKYLQLFEC